MAHPCFFYTVWPQQESGQIDELQLRQPKRNYLRHLGFFANEVTRSLTPRHAERTSDHPSKPERPHNLYLDHIPAATSMPRLELKILSHFVECVGTSFAMFKHVIQVLSFSFALVGLHCEESHNFKEIDLTRAEGQHCSARSTARERIRS